MILLYAWLSMLLIGAARGSLDDRVPTVGYWTLVVLAIAARLLLSGIQTTTAKKADRSKPLIVNQTFNTTGKAHA